MQFRIIHADKLLDEKSPISACTVIGVLVEMCGILSDMFVQRLNESCILKNISVSFTTFCSDTKNNATLPKRHLRGRNKANSRNVDCNIVGTFSAVYSEYAKLHTSSVRGKAVPLRAWSGPEGSSKLRFPDFMTTAQDGGKVVSLKHRPPLPQGNKLVLISVRG